VGERGYFFVNGEFIIELDLSDITGAGDVSVITGAYTGNERDRAVTRYEGFTILGLTKYYGPADGRLIDVEPGKIAEHDSGVWTRTLVAEAEFVNPKGSDWDYGFIIRNPEFNRLEVIGLTDERWWFHYTHDIGDDEYTKLADGNIPAANFRNKNHLLLIALEDAGLFFVNGQLVSRLDLSHNMDYGDVSVIGGFSRDHTGEPEFRNFNVWTP